MPYGSQLHRPLTNYHLLAAQQEPYEKAWLFTKNVVEFSGKKLGEQTISRKMTRQKEQEDLAAKNKRGDRKGEPNDSPEILDLGTEKQERRWKGEPNDSPEILDLGTEKQERRWKGDSNDSPEILDLGTEKQERRWKGEPNDSGEIPDLGTEKQERR